MRKFILIFLAFYLQSNAQEKLVVFFDFKSFNLSVEAKTKIDSIIKISKNIEIEKIEGFCDSIDSNKYNLILSQKRAKSVLDYFKLNEVLISNNTKLVGHGKDFEQSKNQSKNRKAIIYYRFREESNVLKNKIMNSKAGDLIKLENINFYNNLDIILPKSKPILEELLTILKNNSKLKIEIQGHICCKKPNQEDFVSLARAKTIYKFLTDHKIDKNRLKYKGYGVSKPIYKIPEKNSFEEDQNRRVEILIIEK